MKTLILIVLFFTSCAGWRVENTEAVRTFPADISVDEKIKIKLVFEKFENYYNGELKQNSLAETKKQEMIQAIKDVYIESGIFILDDEQPDVTAKIMIKSEGEGSPNRAILTYATLFLIPSSSKLTYTIDTTFLDREGQELASFEQADTIVRWQQLFMVFAMPFKYPYFAERDTLVDLNRATIVAAFRDGHFREVKF